MKIRSLIFLSFLSLQSVAQTESSAFTITGHGVATPFARDYQTIGINPANLDLPGRYENKRMALGLLEFGASLYSEALTKLELRQNFFNDETEAFTYNDQLDYAREFANSANAVDIDVMQFGFSIQTEKAGSFAFSLRDRFDLFSSLSPKASELLWLGYTAPYFEELVLMNGDTIPNTGDLPQSTLDSVVAGVTSLANAESMSELLDGSQFRFSWVREINLAYGKKLWSADQWELHGGIGFKLLIGQGMLDVNAIGGKATAFSSLAPVFQIDYDEIADGNPSAISENAPPLSPVGLGFGVDVGATFILKNKYILSAAVTDIGSMTWDGNVYELNDIKLTSFENSGLESTDFYDQITALNGSDALLTWQGSAKRTSQLPRTGRLGFGAVLGPMIRAGVDVVTSLDENVGSLDRPVIAIGGEFTPIPWLHLSLGVIDGGNYDTKIPAGISFTANEGAYEAGIASRDLITFFSENQPTVSLTMGFLRFRF